MRRWGWGGGWGELEYWQFVTEYKHNCVTEARFWTLDTVPLVSILHGSYIAVIISDNRASSYIAVIMSDNRAVT